jgi:hypothetical protein
MGWVSDGSMYASMHNSIHNSMHNSLHSSMHSNMHKSMQSRGASKKSEQSDQAPNVVEHGSDLTQGLPSPRLAAEQRVDDQPSTEEFLYLWVITQTSSQSKRVSVGEGPSAGKPE